MLISGMNDGTVSIDDSKFGVNIGNFKAHEEEITAMEILNY